MERQREPGEGSDGLGAAVMVTSAQFSQLFLPVRTVNLCQGTPVLRFWIVRTFAWPDASERSPVPSGKVRRARRFGPGGAFKPELQRLRVPAWHGVDGSEADRALRTRAHAQTIHQFPRWGGGPVGGRA